MYVDYAYYSEKYKGILNEEIFDYFNILAKNEIDFYTFNRIDEVTEKIKLCNCRLIDLMQVANENGNGLVSSEKIGTHAIEFNNSDNAYKKLLINTINTMLVFETNSKGENLLYRGLC